MADETCTEPIRERRCDPDVLRLRRNAAWVALTCGAVLGVALWLHPDPRGLGTHRQLGLGPCGFILTTGLPCPTCGMTTAFAHTVRGQLVRAFLAQPAGMLLALAAIVTFATSVWVLLAGRMPRWPLRLAMWLSPYRLLLILLIVLLAAWGFKLAWGLATGELPIRSVRF